MAISKSQRAAIRRAITRFGEAAQEYPFRNAIPVGESEAAVAAYDAIEHEFERSRECLEALIERYMGG